MLTVYQETDTICTVKFSGGTGVSGSRPKSLKGTTGTLVTLPENSYEKDGFEFVGWTDGKNTYPEGSLYRILYTDVTLIAVWNEIPVIQYTIISSAEEGGKISPSGETLVNEGESQEYTKASSTEEAVGKVIKDSSGTTYKVTEGNTVEYTQPKDQSLTSVVIPETVVLNGVSYKVTSISKSALAGCTKLKKVSVGKNITVIGDKAFYNCKALTKIVIPASVVKIGKQAFAKCKNLKQITIKTSKLTSQSVGKNAFKGIYKKPVVKVPKSRKKLYKKILKAKGMPVNAGIK